MLFPKLISYILNPFIWPTIIFSVLFWITPELVPGMANKHILILLICSGSFLVPLFMILTLRNSGVISSIEMRDRKDRYLPILLTTILYFGFSWMLSQKTPQIIYWTIYGISAVLFLILILNFFVKISAHAVAATGSSLFMTLMGIQNQNPKLIAVGIVFLVLSGVLSWARVSLKAHSLKEVWFGISLGLISAFGILLMP